MTDGCGATIACGSMLTSMIKGKSLERILLVLVGFSAGALMGGAFLHLIPESLDNSSSDAVFVTVILGFILFFILEKMLWRHCHEKECQIHAFAYLNLFGDGIHNFINGLVMAADGFIYIAAVDLVPELHKETEKWKTIFSFLSFLSGIALMWLLKFVLEG